MLFPIVLLLSQVHVEPSPLHRYMPCATGLAVHYRFERVENDIVRAIGATMTDVVEGPGKMPATCVIERTLVRADGSKEVDRWMLEMQADHISAAGSVDQPLAFRPPLLRAPVERGKKWRFNTTDYEILDADETVEVPAGRFKGCVRVHERSRDGKHEAVHVYAPDVGLILHVSGTERYVAVRVTRASAESPRTRKR
jgi:hypothetical protein